MDNLHTQDLDFRKTQWQMLFAVMFCYLFFYTGRQNFGWAIMGISEEFNVSKQAIGWAGAGMLWAYGIGQFINGNLADKFGARRMMVLGGMLSFVMNWATSLATSYIMVLIFWTLNGFCQSLGWAPGSKLVANWWGGSERGKAFGFYVFAAGCSSILIYLLSIVMLDVYELDWRWIFRIPVFLLLLGCTVFYFGLSFNRFSKYGSLWAVGVGAALLSRNKNQPIVQRMDCFGSTHWYGIGYYIFRSVVRSFFQIKPI